MRRLGTFFLALFIAASALAQEKKPLFSKLAQKNILNHLDVGVNAGTVGIGIDVAVPVGDYVRVRAGYNYMPRFTIKTNFPVETRNGSISNLIGKIGKIDEIAATYGVDLSSPGFEEYKAMVDKFSNVEKRDYVTMGMKPNLHQFKFLVDVTPFKNNKHWSFTVGFFVGPSDVGEACNLEKESILLEGINSYNNVYASYPNNGLGPGSTYLHALGHANDDPFFRYGLAGFCLGTFADGDKAMMVPSEDNTVHATMQVSKIRPYIGISYNTSLSRNKKWNLNIDGGVLLLCGKPKVIVNNVYKFDASMLKGHMDAGFFCYESGIGTANDFVQANYPYTEYYGDIMRYNPETNTHEPLNNMLNNVDLVRDLHDIPGKVGDMVNLISKFKVYPNISVSVSYRLF